MQRMLQQTTRPYRPRRIPALCSTAHSLFAEDTTATLSFIITARTNTEYGIAATLQIPCENRDAASRGRCCSTSPNRQRRQYPLGCGPGRPRFWPRARCQLRRGTSPEMPTFRLGSADQKVHPCSRYNRELPSALPTDSNIQCVVRIEQETN